MSIWLPENQVVLETRSTANATTLEFESANPWIVPGSKLLVHPGAYVIVDDVFDGGKIVTLSTGTVTPHPAGTFVDLYGHPLEVNGTFPPLDGNVTLPSEFSTGLRPVSSAVVTTDVDTVLAGLSTVDGVTLALGDLVLLTGQADTTENGLWEASPLAWSRPSSFSSGDSAHKAYVFVTGGSTFSGTGWVCTVTAGRGEIDTHPLTWSRLRTVHTFVVHSDHPIYVGDHINYQFLDYPVVASVRTGTHEDGRGTYQITIDIGIPDTLLDGSTTDLFLRAYPAYASENIPLPSVPGPSGEKIGPFLYDRVSGPFYEDMNPVETDIIRMHDAAGNVLSEAVLTDGKNHLEYHQGIPADSFLFWDRSKGRPNFSRDTGKFVAFTDDVGKFHMHFKCVPEIVHRRNGFEGWHTRVVADRDAYMVVHLEPNAIPPSMSGGVFLPAGEEVSVNIDFPSDADPVEYIHLLFRRSPNARSSEGPWSFSDGDELDVSVDGGPKHVVVFTAADFPDITAVTPEDLVVFLNSQIPGASARVLGHHVTLGSSSIGKDSSIQILGGLANASLGFPTTLHGEYMPSNARIDMGSWEVRGVATPVFMSHVTIAHVSGGNSWASSSAFAKPNWLRLAYLVVQSDLYAKFNSGLLST